jgi:hypothetical protein
MSFPKSDAPQAANLPPTIDGLRQTRVIMLPEEVHAACMIPQASLTSLKHNSLLKHQSSGGIAD